MKATNPKDYTVTMTDPPGRRLQKAREQAGFETATEFAEHCGIKITTYLQHENGRRPLTRDNAAFYARFLKQPASWLLFGERLQSNSPVSILGCVGNEAYVDHMDMPANESSVATDDIDELVALTVVGNQLEPKYYNGDRLFHQRLRRGRYILQDLDQVECVVETAGGQVMVRTICTDIRGFSELSGFGLPVIRVHVVAASPIEYVKRSLPARIRNR